MQQPNAEAAKHLSAAKDRLAEWRKIVASMIDPNHPTQDIRSQISSEKSAKEIHAAVDALLATGDGYDLLALCVALEHVLSDAASDHDAKSKTPLRSPDPHRVGQPSQVEYLGKAKD